MTIRIEELQQAHNCAELSGRALNRAIDGATAIEALALHRLLRQASELRAEIAALLSAVKPDLEWEQDQ